MPRPCVRGKELLLYFLSHWLQHLDVGRELAAFLQQNPKLEIAGDTLEEPF